MISRKLVLLYIVLTLATLGTFVPPILVWIINFHNKNNVPSFEILGSTEWITMVSLLVTSYFGINHMDKRAALQNGIPPNQLDHACNNITNNPPSRPEIQVNVNQENAMKRGDQ